ncbi:MAG: GntR family transcriptional regulator [Phycisphaeraceae bacterium]|nr:GntR family transcriptional regulator [Phycisphaeraceae bacterium]
MDIQQTLADIAPTLSRDGDQPMYRQIAAAIAQRVAQGELVPGQLLPPLAELAKLLGVGQMTIRKAMEELAARRLVVTRQGSGTRIADEHQPRRAALAGTPPIHIVCDDTADGYPFLVPVTRHLREVIARHDGKQDDHACRHVSLPVKEDDPAVVASLIDLSHTRGIVFNSPLNMTLLSMCIRRGVPYVLLFNELSDGNSPCVVIDYGNGLNEAMSHCRDARRRRVVLMTPDAQRFATGRLTELFLALLDAYGFPHGAQTVIEAGYHQQQAYRKTRDLLRGKRRPDAILFSSDYQALGGLLAAKELNVRVPDDLAVIGMGNVLEPADWPHRVSTIDLHLDRFCQLAFAALLPDTARVQRRQVVKSSFQPGQTSS